MIKKIILTYKNKGLAAVFKKSLYFLKSNIYFKRYIWYERNLLAPITVVSTKAFLAHVDFNARDEVIDWIDRNIYHGRVPKDELVERKIALENMHILSAIKINGDIIGYMKIGFGKVYIVNYRKIFDLSDRTAFVYSMYISKDHRNHGLATFMLAGLSEFLKGKGFRNLACHIREDNASSIRACSKNGLKPIDQSWQIKFFNLTIFSRPPVAVLG